jgi:hypothetical protein
LKPVAPVGFQHGFPRHVPPAGAAARSATCGVPADTSYAHRAKLVPPATGSPSSACTVSPRSHFQASLRFAGVDGSFSWNDAPPAAWQPVRGASAPEHAP